MGGEGGRNSSFLFIIKLFKTLTLILTLVAKSPKFGVILTHDSILYLQSLRIVITWTNHSPAMPFTRTLTKPTSLVHRGWFNSSKPSASAAIFSTKPMLTSQVCTHNWAELWGHNKSKKKTENWIHLCVCLCIHACILHWMHWTVKNGYVVN